MNWSLWQLFRNLQHFAVIFAYALLVWLLLRRPWKRRPLAREIVLPLFIGLVACLLYLTLDGEWDTPSAMLHSALTRLKTADRIRLTPFKGIAAQLAAIDQIDILVQLGGNIVMFAPWGFCLPLLWRRFRTPLRMICMSLALTCLIEFTQLFIDRYVEIDDILLNFLGSMAGTGVWWSLHRRYPQMDALFLPAESR